MSECWICFLILLSPVTDINFRIRTRPSVRWSILPGWFSFVLMQSSGSPIISRRCFAAVKRHCTRPEWVSLGFQGCTKLAIWIHIASGEYRCAVAHEMLLQFCKCLLTSRCFLIINLFIGTSSKAKSADVMVYYFCHTFYASFIIFVFSSWSLICCGFVFLGVFF